MFAALNISDYMANYLTMSVDITLRSFYEYMTTVAVGTGPIFIEMMEKSAEQLDKILKDNNLNNMELMRNIAISCDELIMMCEVHRALYLSTKTGLNNNSDSCCSNFFNVSPLFTNAGVCYTSKAEVYETLPSTVSNIQIFMDLSNSNTPSTCPITLY